MKINPTAPSSSPSSSSSSSSSTTLNTTMVMTKKKTKTTRGSFLAITVLVLLSQAVDVVTADEYGIIEWMPQCVETSTTAMEMVLCIQENFDSECFPDGFEEEIQTCLESYLPNDSPTLNPSSPSILPSPQQVDNGQDNGSVAAKKETIVDAVETCLEPYLTCMQSHMEDLVSTLHPCVNETLVALAVCAMENATECAGSCVETWSAIDIDDDTTTDSNLESTVSALHGQVTSGPLRDSKAGLAQAATSIKRVHWKPSLEEATQGEVNRTGCRFDKAKTRWIHGYD